MKMYIMQALHRKLDVVLVQILPYNNCSETDYSDSPQPSIEMQVSPSNPFNPSPIFFAPPPLTDAVLSLWSQSLRISLIELQG